MWYYLILRWNGGADCRLTDSSDLKEMLVMRDKLNGEHPDTNHQVMDSSDIPLNTNYEAIVLCEPYCSAMSWSNIEDSERPQYTRE